MKPVIWFALALVVTLTYQHSYAQTTPTQADAGITSTRVMGELKSIDSAAKQFTVKTDASSLVTVSLADSTAFSRIPPGEKTLDKAAKISFADLGEGDRVLAVGNVADDRKSVTARTVLVISKGDIAKRQEAERLEWRRRGILGVISAVKPDKKEISISTRSPMGTQTVVMAIPDKLDMRRYAPDSTKFGDAKPSDFSELKVGDQVRALGDRSTDGIRFTPERIVSGSFRTVAGVVTSIEPSGEVKINDLLTRKPLTIVLKPDSVIRKFPDMAAMMAAARAGAGGPGAGGPGAGGPGANSSKPGGTAAGGPAPGGPTPGPTVNGPTAGSPRPNASTPSPSGQGPAQPATATNQPKSGAPASPAGPPPGAAAPSIQDMLDRLPPITAAQLKAGDTIIVSSTNGADPSRLTAITLISGADTLLAMVAPKPPGTGQAAPNPASGLGSGVTFGIGLP